MLCLLGIYHLYISRLHEATMTMFGGLFTEDDPTIIGANKGKSRHVNLWSIKSDSKLSISNSLSNDFPYINLLAK